MVAEGLNPPDQLVIDHARGAIFQLAHALVEQVDQVFDPVGHRRVSGEAAVARIALLGDRAFGAGAILQIDRLCHRNDFRQNLDFLVDARPAAEEGVDRLFEIEQPERQANVARREHLRLVAEAVAIFVVRIDQENAQIRPRLENLLQNDGNAARLADAGGAENRKVAAHQLVDVDVDVDVRILLQVADMGAIGIGRAVDQLQLAFAEQHGAVADIGIFRDAALEARRAGLAGPDLADQIEPRHLAVVLHAARSCHELLLADIGDQPDDDGLARQQAHEFSDGRIFAFRRARA